MRPNMLENLKPVPIEEALSGLCDRTDAAWRIGRDVVEGRLATHDPSKYVVIPKDVFLTPRSDGDDVKDDVELTITIPVTVAWDWEEDDDGCGPASRTGNSMTGRRGRYKSVVAASVTPEDLAKAVGIALDDYAQTTEIEEGEYQ